MQSGRTLKKRRLFLGLDLSTQSMTALAIDPEAGAIRSHAIPFDSRYPAYGTREGVLQGSAPGVVHADPRMWIESLDDIFAWLKKSRLSESIRGIGVSTQQHGTVYLNSNAFNRISGVIPGRPLKPQLENIFSRCTCPVWMDTSTTRECEEITAALGGEANAATLTGSVITERFAAPQIRKFWKEAPDAYQDTHQITLISAFVTSLLIGSAASVDAGDGYGTNLADVRSGTWSPRAIEAAAPDLGRRLPDLYTADAEVGMVSSYWVKRYGLRPDTKVVIGSGDNPCSLAGLGLIGNTDTHAISLGTSDTYFGYFPKSAFQRNETGHLFGAADGGFMFLICFQNGGLARQRIKEAYGLSWKAFSDILLRTPPGNRGRILLPYFFPEITPKIPFPNVRRFGGLAPDDPGGNVRGIVEAQAMALYLHSGWLRKRPREIVATAGGSENPGILQVIADIFRIPVRSFAVKESAALGAAFRAARIVSKGDGVPFHFEDLFRIFLKTAGTSSVSPSPIAAEIYHGNNGLLEVYRACEAQVLGMGTPPQSRINNFKKHFSGYT